MFKNRQNRHTFMEIGMWEEKSAHVVENDNPLVTIKPFKTSVDSVAHFPPDAAWTLLVVWTESNVYLFTKFYSNTTKVSFHSTYNLPVFPHISGNKYVLLQSPVLHMHAVTDVSTFLEHLQFYRNFSFVRDSRTVQASSSPMAAAAGECQLRWPGRRAASLWRVYLGPRQCTHDLDAWPWQIEPEVCAPHAVEDAVIEKKDGKYWNAFVFGGRLGDLSQQYKWHCWKTRYRFAT